MSIDHRSFLFKGRGIFKNALEFCPRSIDRKRFECTREKGNKTGAYWKDGFISNPFENGTLLHMIVLELLRAKVRSI